MDLISQNDIEIIKSTIMEKANEARIIAENKLTNFIENFRHKHKTSIDIHALERP